ncbi:hypothetical protein [Pseudomonas sp. NFACC08-1]|uniref:hypothetical protein n=1 Tax=Pseudomonas sp. NFACC08-1 TaxID=1566238 RepID=UPI0008980EAE|nr:hypothetical protein [Pseudomonas sp. NFACC08-1]SDX26761.1 Scavenger mRNA decapping enzyme C-term binding [Pseudomonas sp. NFACC08-1]
MTSIQVLQYSAATKLADSSQSRHQAPDVQAVRNSQVYPKTHKYSEISRTLDAYGIDDNRNILSQLSQDKYQVLIKSDNSGVADFNHGAYISKKLEDDYGAFRWLSPRGLQKYQTDDLAQVTLGTTNLAQLQQTYKDAPVTQFLVELLYGNNRESGNKVYDEVYKENPDVFYYSAPLGMDNGFLIYPNIPYMSKTYTEGKTTDLSTRPEGIQLMAWAVHPTAPQDLIQEINGDLSIGKKTTSQKIELNQRRAESMSGVKSLTSILDLEQGDVEMLEKLKMDSLQHLLDIYGVSAEKDKINLFFHFPVAPSTATLHLHIWVNKGDHPLNESRAFAIDEVIHHLRQGENIDTLILSRNEGQFILPTKDMLHQIKGMPESKTPSPVDYRELKLPIGVANG